LGLSLLTLMLPPDAWAVSLSRRAWPGLARFPRDESGLILLEDVMTDTKTLTESKRALARKRWIAAPKGKRHAAWEKLRDATTDALKAETGALV